jgi:hypothetical protein
MNEREIRQALEAGHFGHFDHLKKGADLTSGGVPGGYLKMGGI